MTRCDNARLLRAPVPSTLFHVRGKELFFLPLSSDNENHSGILSVDTKLQ